MPSRRSTSQSEEKPEGIDKEDELGYYQPTFWWFASVVFPLIAGTFGPIANLFSICAVSQSWLVSKPSGTRISDPGWLLALNILSLVAAILANFFLLFNFAKRIPYTIAQPLTILFWYLSTILLLIPIIITHTTLLHHHSSYALSQSYYYGFISTILYFTISTLLLFNLLGSYVFHAYPPSFAQLSTPQRTLMLQTIFFSAYLALGAGIFSSIEHWNFVDGLYWADYTLLTIGLGSDFPVQKTSGRMILIPYATVGIVIIGLIVNSVRKLVIERAGERIMERRLEKERRKWMGVVECLRDGREDEARKVLSKFTKARKRLASEEEEEEKEEGEHRLWRRREFELMRYIEQSATRTEGYIALAFSLFFFAFVWVGGSLVFWACEFNAASWTYTESLYFTFTSIATIGYGDFYPTTSATRPFFVIWSLIAVPSVTVLIAIMGETVVKEVESAVEWVGRRSLLPEKPVVVVDEKRKEEEAAKPSTIVLPTLEVPRSPRPPSSRTPPAEETTTQAETQRELLSIRLSKEITKVAEDVLMRPLLKYSWHEWVKWLTMMDETGDMLGVHRDGDEGDATTHSSSTGASTMSGHARQSGQEGRKTAVEIWKWTWLDDSGPLFSPETETQWVLNRLCRLFERAVEKEIVERDRR